MSLIRELKERRRWRQQERQKSNGFRSARQQLCTCITLFCTFLCRRCTSTTWKYLNSRFVEDGNTRQQLSFYFPELWYSPSPSQFNSKGICQHLTNWTRQNKRDEVWSSANFKSRFRSSRCWRIRTESKSSIFFLRKSVPNVTISTALTLIKKMKNFEVLQVYWRGMVYC